jgi:hypothetical protein
MKLLCALLERQGRQKAGAASLWPAFDAFKHQYQAQRDLDLDRIDGSGRRLVKLRCDAAPCRLIPVLFRQMPHELAHVGERPRRHYRGDDKRLGQRPGPF